MNQRRGLHYVEMGGRQRPYRFGTNQSAIYCQLRKCTLAAYLKDMNTERIINNEVDGTEIRDLVYSALAAGASSQNEKVEFNNMTVGDWIDEMEQEELTNMFKVLTAQNSPNGQGAIQPPTQTETTTE